MRGAITSPTIPIFEPLFCKLSIFVPILLCIVMYHTVIKFYSNWYGNQFSISPNNSKSSLFSIYAGSNKFTELNSCNSMFTMNKLLLSNLSSHLSFSLEKNFSLGTVAREAGTSNHGLFNHRLIKDWSRIIGLLTDRSDLKNTYSRSNIFITGPEG